MQHWQPDWPLSFIAVDPPAMASTTPLLALPRPGPSCGRRRLGARLPGTCSPCRPGEPSARGQTRSQASALILQQIWPGLPDLPGQVGQTSPFAQPDPVADAKADAAAARRRPPELLDVDVFMPGPESCSSFVNGAGFTYHQPSLHCSWHPASTWSLAHRNGSGPAWQLKARGWVLDAARSPMQLSSRPGSLLLCPGTGLSQGLVYGRRGRSRTAC
jgi:hypothetical protein